MDKNRFIELLDELDASSLDTLKRKIRNTLKIMTCYTILTLEAKSWVKQWQKLAGDI